MINRLQRGIYRVAADIGILLHPFYGRSYVKRTVAVGNGLVAGVDTVNNRATTFPARW